MQVNKLDLTAEHNWILINGDTDSISISDSYGLLDSPEKWKPFMEKLNSLLPDYIEYDDDGFFPKFVVLRAKNYIMLTPEGKIKIKGSALKSSKIEKAITVYHKHCINSLLGLSTTPLLEIYQTACEELTRLTTIADWSSKKTISEKTVKSTRKNESKILDALKGTHYQLGDKFNFYTTNQSTLKLEEHYNPNNPDHDLKRLLSKIYKSSAVFDNVSPELKARTNYGLSTKAKEFNSMVRKKVLPVKESKPTPKNVLEELLRLLEYKEIEVKDEYAGNEFESVLEKAKLVLAKKEKKPKECNDV